MNYPWVTALKLAFAMSGQKGYWPDLTRELVREIAFRQRMYRKYGVRV
jgi:hypothetical protein